MKNIKVLLLAFGVLAVTNLVAQTSSRLNGKEFTVYVNQTENPTEATQITDVFTFAGSDFTSREAGKTGIPAARYSENLNGTRTNFSVALTKANGETWTYTGFMEDNHMGGTLVITSPGQAARNYEFRGMTTQQWNAMMQRANTPSTE